MSHLSRVPHRISRLACAALLASPFYGSGVMAQTAPSADQLFNWIERIYPDLFPTGPATQSIAPYTVRAYNTGNYLGVANGNLYILGPITAHMLFNFGPTVQFACQVTPTATGCPGVPAPTPAPTPAPSAGTCNLPDFETELVAAVNQKRAAGAQCGSSGNFVATTALSWNTTMFAAALGHSNDMQQLNFFSHTGSNGSDPGQRLTNAGYSWRTYGENIAAGQSSVQSVVNGWMNSPGHCANIMNSSFREIAVACVKGGTGNTYGTYWTMVLGTQR